VPTFRSAKSAETYVVPTFRSAKSAATLAAGRRWLR
jgi:hypothetical protein